MSPTFYIPPIRAIFLFYGSGDNVFVTTDHMGEPMSLNVVVQNLQVTLTEYSVKIQEQSKVREDTYTGL